MPKLCPLTYTLREGCADCCESRCAWWIEADQKCAVPAISHDIYIGAADISSAITDNRP